MIKIEHVLLSIGFLLLFFCIDIIGGKKEEVNVLVLDKVYTPSSTSVGVNNAYSGGEVYNTTTVNYEPEKFTIIVKYNKEIYTLEVTSKKYYEINKNDELKVNLVKGCVTGLNHGLTE